jgi:hypothetical protein
MPSIAFTLSWGGGTHNSIVRNIVGSFLMGGGEAV